MVARLLNMCGLDLGPSDRLIKPTQANPLGHFEHRGFLDIDRKLLKLFNGTWYNPPDLPPRWTEDSRLSPLYDEARTLAATFPRASPWGWKEPRAALFLPFWKNAIPDMRFLLCIRDPLEVAASLARRNGLSADQGAALWYRYTLASLADTDGCPRLIVFFDKFFKAVSQEVARVIDFCGLAMPPQNDLINQAIVPQLRNHTSSIEDLMTTAAADTDCKLLHFYLRQMALGDSGAKNGDSAATDRLLTAYVRALQERRANSAGYKISAPTKFAQLSRTVKRFSDGLRKIIIPMGPQRKNK